MSKAERFRSRNAIATAFVAYGMLALFAVEEWLTASAADFFRAACILAVVGEFIYFIFLRPIVILSDECARIINPFSEHVIGWQDIESIEARYSMNIETIDGDRIYAWAASAPGRYHSRKIHPADIRGMGLTNIIRAGESPRTDSGVATHLARLKLKEFGETANFPRSYKRNIAGIVVLITNIAAALIFNMY